LSAAYAASAADVSDVVVNVPANCAGYSAPEQVPGCCACESSEWRTDESFRQSRCAHPFQRRTDETTRINERFSAAEPAA
jgi:hypothetical protein